MAHSREEGNSGISPDIIKEIREIIQESFFISVNEMAIIMERKKGKKAQKKEAFSCFVLNGYDELASFLVRLKEKMNSMPDGTRFQIVNSVNNAHWLSGDVRIHNKKLEFYFLDSYHTSKYIEEVIYVVRRIFDDAIIRVTIAKTQKDSDNCGTFAMDHVFRFAKLPSLHEMLAKIPSHPFKNISDFKNITAISIENYPKEFSPLFRNMQSVSTLKKLDWQNKPGNDTRTLKDYLSVPEKNRLYTKLYVTQSKLSMSEQVREKNCYVFIQDQEKLFFIIDNDENEEVKGLADDFDARLAEIKQGMGYRTNITLTPDQAAKLILTTEKHPKLINRAIEVKKKRVRQKTLKFLDKLSPDEYTRIMKDRLGDQFLSQFHHAPAAAAASATAAMIASGGSPIHTAQKADSANTESKETHGLTPKNHTLG